MTRDTTQRLAVSALIAHLEHGPPMTPPMLFLVAKVKAAFAPPRLVQVGDAPAEVANYEAVQDAVSDAMLEPYLPAPNPTFTSPERSVTDGGDHG